MNVLFITNNKRFLILNCLFTTQIYGILWKSRPKELPQHLTLKELLRIPNVIKCGNIIRIYKLTQHDYRWSLSFEVKVGGVSSVGVHRTFTIILQSAYVEKVGDGAQIRSYNPEFRMPTCRHLNYMIIGFLFDFSNSSGSCLLTHIRVVSFLIIYWITLYVNLLSYTAMHFNPFVIYLYFYCSQNNLKI